jgi:hypothetical protein
LENALRIVLEKSLGTDRLLVVADQFEELFNLTPETIRKPFVEHILAVTEKLPVTLVISLRVDFYEDAHSLDALRDRLESAQLNIGQINRSELRRAVCEPARLVGLEFEPGLVDRILDGVGEEPGNLPLLEFALTEIWARRSSHRLTHAAYTECGEVAGAIAQKAEAQFGRLTPAESNAAKRVFTNLVRVARPGDGSRDTRRRANLADFADAAQQVARKLAGPESRLLVIGSNEEAESVVEMVHEALIQRWHRLQEWLAEDRELLLWRERLRVHIAEHQRNETLLSGAPLTEAELWLAERRKDLNAGEVSFIEASAKAQDPDTLRGEAAATPGAAHGTVVSALHAATETKRRMRVFLCHSSADKPRVRILRDKLGDAGLDPWLDDKNLIPGQKWPEEIPNAVRRSDVVLVCLSRDSITKAGWVQREIAIAIDAAHEQPEGEIYLIPVKLEECDVPKRLADYHWVNFFEEGGYERLFEALRVKASGLTNVLAF